MSIFSVAIIATVIIAFLNARMDSPSFLFKQPLKRKRNDTPLPAEKPVGVMDETARYFAAVLILSFVMTGCDTQHTIPKKFNTTSTFPANPPSERLETLCSSVSSLIESSSVPVGEIAKDKKEISKFFYQLASRVEKEPKIIETTGDFREFNSKYTHKER